MAEESTEPKTLESVVAKWRATNPGQTALAEIEGRLRAKGIDPYYYGSAEHLDNLGKYPLYQPITKIAPPTRPEKKEPEHLFPVKEDDNFFVKLIKKGAHALWPTKEGVKTAVQSEDESIPFEEGDDLLTMLKKIGASATYGMLSPLLKAGYRTTQGIYELTEGQDARNQMMEAYDAVDAQVAAKLRKLPEEKRERLLRFMAERGNWDMPTIFEDPVVDVDNFTQFKQAALGSGMVALLTTNALIGSKTAATAVESYNLGSKYALWKLAPHMAAWGGDFALFFLLEDLAKEEIDKSPEEIANDFAKNFGIGSVIGGITGIGQRGFKALKKGLSAKYGDNLVDVANVASKSVRKVAGFSPTYYRPKKPGPIKRVLTPGEVLTRTEKGGAERVIKDFGSALPGDVIKTKSGVIGVVAEVSETTGMSIAEYTARELTKRLDDLSSSVGRLKAERDRLKAIDRRYLTEKEVAITPTELIAGNRARNKTIKNIEEKLGVLQEQQYQLRQQLSQSQAESLQMGLFQDRGRTVSERMIAGEPLEPPRIRTVRLKTGIDNQTGKVKYVEMPVEEITGGRVLGRTIQRPTNLATLRKSAPEIAEQAERTGLEITQAQAADDLVTVTTRTATGEVDHIILPRHGNVSRRAEAMIMENLRARGHLVGRGSEFTPKSTTLWDQYYSDAAGLRKSGVDPTPIRRAEERMIKYLAKQGERLTSKMDEVLKEANIKTGLAGVLQIGRTKRSRELSRKLFRAANEPNYGGQYLTAKQKELVDMWHDVARDLLERTNTVLVQMGKKPVAARDPYITNVVSELGRAYQAATGSVPIEVSRLFDTNMLKRLVKDFEGKGSSEIVNKLLERRVGGLPLEEDFFRAADIAMRTHSQFGFMMPEFLEIRSALEAFRKLNATVWGNKFTHNVKFMENFLNRLAGTATEVSALRNLDARIKTVLVAKTWKGVVPNPFRRMFGTTRTIEVGGVTEEFFGLRPGVSRFIDEHGVGTWPRGLKAMKYAQDLTASPAYMFTNITQYFTMVPARLRGKAVKRWSDTMYGFGRAFMEIWSEKNWKKWEASGLLAEIRNQMQHEFGYTSKGIGALGLKNKRGPVNKILNFSTRSTEFLNRVGAYHAANRNMLKSSKNYWKELSDLAGEDLIKAAEDLSHELSNITQFRYGRTYRSQFADNPILALWDQYGTFFRNWLDSMGDMVRKHRKAFDTPEWKSAMDKLHKGDIQPALDYIKQYRGTEAAALINYMTESTLFAMVLGTLGGSFAWEFWAGGFPRFGNAMVEMLQGVKDNDEAKWRRGLREFMSPPAFDPFIKGVSDTWTITKGDKKFRLKPMALQPYSPFRKATLSWDALMAAVTKQPVAVADPDTGDPIYYIDPDDAMENFFFGYRRLDEKERQKAMTKAASLRAKGDLRSREESLEASEVIEGIKSAKTTVEARTYLVGKMGEWDEQKRRRMLDKIQETWYGQNLQEDQLARSVSYLPSEERAAFLKWYSKSVPKSEYHKILQQMTLLGHITPTTAAYLKEGHLPPESKDLDERKLNKKFDRGDIELPLGLTGENPALDNNE